MLQEDTQNITADFLTGNNAIFDTFDSKEWENSYN